jgi:K+-sensing histidine kinase KdpD
LGLSVTKRIIELHGGQIQLQNRDEGGVCATIRLPVEPAATSGPTEKAAAERACGEAPSPLA